MKLGEKISALRKEKGWSQEELAQQLNTTRQAISKWENDQGYPEMEKLLQLSSIFAVSMDFLLKDAVDTEVKSEKGYYINKEMARGFLAHEKRNARYAGLCFMLWSFAGIPYVMLDTWRFLGVSVFVIGGIVFAVIGMLTEQQEYKAWKEDPLLLDYELLQELREEHAALKKRQQILLVPCIILFVCGLLAVALTIRGYIEWTKYHALVFFGLGIGLFGFVTALSTLEAFALLVENTQHCNRFFFKMRRKLKEKLDRW